MGNVETEDVVVSLEYDEVSITLLGLTHLRHKIRKLASRQGACSGH